MQVEDIQRILQPKPEKAKSWKCPTTRDEYRTARRMKFLISSSRWLGWFAILAGPGYVLTHYFGRDVGVTYWVTMSCSYMAGQITHTK